MHIIVMSLTSAPQCPPVLLRHKMNLAAMFLVCQLLCYLYLGINRKGKGGNSFGIFAEYYVMGSKL